MSTDLEQCEQLARQLPLQERSVLLAHLISSLDELNASECENLWLEEAGRRYREYNRPTGGRSFSGHTGKIG